MATTLFFVETSGAEKRKVLCQWVERFYEEGLRIVVVTDSSQAAQHLDQMLWSFSQSSFIPHRIVARTPAEGVIEPVIIVPNALTVPGYEVAVADSPVTLHYLQPFTTAVHFVLTDDPDQRQDSRLLWQNARDHGWTLRHLHQTAAGRP